MPTQVPLLSYTRSAELQTPEQIEFDLDSYRDKNYLTHNFHPYPAKFVPQIPRRIIEALSRKDEIVIDPFCGSGTTLVEANLLGRHGIGFDSNALAVLISRVKTTALSADSLRKIAQFLSDVGNQVQVVKGKLRIPSSSIPEFRNKDHWFESHIQNELAFIKKLIFDVPDARVRDFLKVAFSAIIVKASNQDSDTRWVAVKKNLPEGFAIEAFLSKARDMLSRMAEFSKVELGTSEIRQRSVADGFPLSTTGVDLIVTSPPYLNSYDYYLYHKLRFFWLGLDHYQAQSEEIGSRHRHSDKGEGLNAYGSSILSSLRKMHSVLKPGRHLCVVIGDAILKGNLVEMDSLYASLGQTANFRLDHCFSYDQRKYTQSFTRNLKTQRKRSHIMFFQKP